MRKFEINYTHQGEVLASDFALLAHSLVQTPMANEDVISHLSTIVRSWKRRHS